MKKLLTIAILSLVALVAKADYTLYWMANPWSASYWGADFAALKGGSSDGSYTMLEMAYLNEGANTLINTSTGGSYVDYIVSLYTYNNTDGWVELAVSWDHYSYDDLINSVYAYENKGQETQMAKDPLVFRSFVIPEPTSGLMLLLGLAALALKRKLA